MPSSIGSLSSAAAPRGPLWFDVSKYGARPGDATNSLNAAWAKILPLLQPGATVYIPPHPAGFKLTDPIVCPVSDVRFVGEGRAQSTITTNTACSGIVVGLPYADDGTATGPKMASDHFVSLSGVLDSSFGGGRYGMRFNSPSTGKTRIGFFPDSPFAYGPGDAWGGAMSQRLTWEFAVLGYVGGNPAFLPDGATFGLVDANSKPSPWSFVFQHAHLDSTTNQATARGGTTNTITLAAGTTANLAPVGKQVLLLSGPGAGQIRTVTAYDAANRVATVDTMWATAPTSATVYTVGSPGIVLNFRTADYPLNGESGAFDPAYGGTSRVLTWAFGATTGLQRITVQLDLTATTLHNLAQCWVSTGGSTGSGLASFTQLADPTADGDTSAKMAAGSGLPNPFLQQNCYVPFQVNNCGPLAQTTTIPGFTGPMTVAPNTYTPDWMLAALAITAGDSGGNLYAVGSAGSAQSLNASGPATSTTVNDSFRYSWATNTAARIVSLMSQDSPTSDPYGGFLAHWRTGTGLPNGLNGTNGNGYWLPAVKWTWGSDYVFKDLQITSGHGWGEAVGIGLVFNSDCRGLQIGGFYHGIGQLGTGSNYNHTVRDLECQNCYDAGIFGIESIFWGGDLSFGNPTGRCVLRGAGTDFYFDKMQLHGGQMVGTHSIVASHAMGGGGNITLGEFYYDAEGGGLPTPGGIGLLPDVAVFAIENGGPGSNAKLVIDKAGIGSMSFDACFVKLRNGGFTTPVTVSIRDVQIQGTARALVQVDSAAGFFGSVERIQWHDLVGSMIDGLSLIESLDGSGRSGVKACVESRELRTDGQPLPPRWGLITAGAVEVRCPDAAPGQYTRLVATATGRYGSATAPVWCGLDPYRPHDGPADTAWDAAAYVLPEDSITLTAPTMA